MRYSSRIRGHADLVRPKNSGGVVNTNLDEWQKANRRLQQAEKNKQLESRVSAMEGKLDLILGLLQKDTHHE